MEKMTRSELQKLQTINELDVVTDKQLAGYVMAATHDIEKSTTAEDTKRTVEKEVSSFTPIEVYDDIDGHIEKSIVFIRPAQIAWTDKENGKGVYKDTPLNRELYRVGDDIQKGKAAVSGEVRTWGGKKYKKLPNGKWMEVSEQGLNKREHGSAGEKTYKEAVSLQEGKEYADYYGKNAKKVTDLHVIASNHKTFANYLSDKEYDEDELGDDIQKGKAAVSGEIRTWGGKKYKKQPNGKWVEISEQGGTKKEHEYQSGYAKEMKEKPSLHTAKHEDAEKWHKEQAEKLSDKEYDEDELDKESSGEKFKLKADMPYMVSLANLRGKELKSKGTKEVSFATGKQTYHVFDVDGEEVEVPERFLDKVGEKNDTGK